MISNRVKYIIFDIGGVLVDLNLFEKLLNWTDKNNNLDKIREIWFYSESVHKYETGKIDFTNFALNLISELNLKINLDEFVKEYKYFISDIFPNVLEIFITLKKNYKIGCLSNIGEIHHNQIKNDTSYLLFDVEYLSYKIGIMKPNKEAFTYMINDLNITANEILYFDDSLPNIEMSKSLGIHSVLVKNTFNDVIEYLKLNSFI